MSSVEHFKEYITECVNGSTPDDCENDDWFLVGYDAWKENLVSDDVADLTKLLGKKALITNEKRRMTSLEFLFFTSNNFVITL